LAANKVTIYPPVGNFVKSIFAKKYDSWLPVDKVIAIIINILLSGPPCIKMQDFRICHTTDLKSKDITQVETGLFLLFYDDAYHSFIQAIFGIFGLD